MLSLLIGLSFLIRWSKKKKEVCPRGQWINLTKVIDELIFGSEILIENEFFLMINKRKNDLESWVNKRWWGANILW